MAIPENRFLLAMLHLPETSRQEMPQSPAIQDLDWHALHVRAQLLGVKHLLYYQFKEHQLLDKIPPWFKNDCEADYFKNAARNSVLLADAQNLRNTFAAHDIPLLFLKGVGLLFEKIYPSIGLRTLSDIDGLVHEKDLEKCENLLLQMGYRLSEATPLDQETYRRKKNHLKPYLSPNGSPLEVHWCLEPYRSLGQRTCQDHSRIWARAIMHENFLALAPESHLINIAVHLMKTDLFAFDLLIKARMDWDALMRRYENDLDWQEMKHEILSRKLTYEWNWTIQALRATGYEPVQEACLLVNQTLEPRAEHRKIAAFLRHAKPGVEPQETVLSISLRKEIYTRRKIGLLWRIIWPHRAYLAKSFNRSPADARLFLFYPLRIFLLAKRFLKFLWPNRLLSYLRTPQDWREACLIFWTLCKLPLYQRFLSLDGMLRKLSKSTLPVKSCATLPQKVQKTIALGEWFLGLNIAMFRPTCLKRSLLFYRLFRREGLPVAIHFGLRSLGEDKKLDGHAWLTLNDQIILEDNPKVFTETYHFP